MAKKKTNNQKLTIRHKRHQVDSGTFEHLGKFVPVNIQTFQSGQENGQVSASHLPARLHAARQLGNLLEFEQPQVDALGQDQRDVFHFGYERRHPLQRIGESLQNCF